MPEHQLLARIGYDVPTGPLAGLGAYAELVMQDGVFLDDADLLRVPGFAVLNLDVHDATALAGDPRRLDLYGEARNVLDTASVGAADPLADTLNAATGLQNGRSVLRHQRRDLRRPAPDLRHRDAAALLIRLRPAPPLVESCRSCLSKLEVCQTDGDARDLDD